MDKYKALIISGVRSIVMIYGYNQAIIALEDILKDLRKNDIDRRS